VRSRRPTWRLWTGIGAGLAVYAGLGYWWATVGGFEGWLYRIGLTAATVLPLAFVAVYTRIAFRPETQVKWWQDEIGSSLVLAALSVVPVAAPLAYTFWFQGGNLTASWLAYLAVSGPCLTALAWARLCWIWVRVSRAKEAK
jgi:hypothetical protein